jgi:hypothetical protein
MTTKLNLVRRLPKYLVVAHGEYRTTNHFVVPDDKIFIFMSKSGRYLQRSVLSPELDSFLRTGNFDGPVPKPLQGWKSRIYGPGDRCVDIHLAFQDQRIPGFGVFKLPMSLNTLMTHHGTGHGGAGFLSEFAQRTPPGVYIIVACRAFSGQSKFFQNQNVNYRFPRGTFIQALNNQNRVTSRLLKRRRDSPGTRSPAKKRRLQYI